MTFRNDCYADYSKFLAETKLVADELGAEQISSDISFRTATEEDKERIKSAVDSEGSIHGNVDWDAKSWGPIFLSVPTQVQH